MEEDILNKEVGNKEVEILKPEPVLVGGIVVEDVIRKVDSKVVGKKVVVLAKHPKREEPIKISQIKFVKGKTIKTTTIWVNLDSDDKIQKGSAVDKLLELGQVKTLKELEGKTLNTDIGADGYLCIKGY